MHNAIRVFAFIRRLLYTALAFSLIQIPICIGAFEPADAQDSVQGTEGVTAVAPVVPQQVRYAGKLALRTGDSVEAVFRIYAAEQGGDPLWTETQRVTVAEDGSYAVLLGSASSSGLPQTVFAGGAARWLGVSVERGPEQDRVLLSSVPYAMKSADAESLAGHAASDFVTQSQLAHLAESAPTSAQSGGVSATITPLTSGTVTGSGSAGTVPLWTGTLTQGNSLITQSGSEIGINEAAPGATLDVGGTANFRGTATLPAESTATTSAGYRSQLLDFSDSAWSTTTKAPVTQTWRLYAIDSGNNSANPTSSLNFQFQNGAGAPTPTILSIEQNGVISFSPSQTFPGTLNSVTATSPLTAATTSGAVSLALDTTALATDIAPTLNNNYAQLNAANTFSAGKQTFNTPVSMSASEEGAPTLAVFNTNADNEINPYSNAIYAASFSNSPAIYASGQYNGIGVQVNGGGDKTSIGLLGDEGGFQSSTFQRDNGTLGYSAAIWADAIPACNNFTPPCGTAALFATADTQNAAIFENNSSTAPTIYVDNLATNGPTGNVVLLRAEGADGVCSINHAGSMSCTGQLKNLVTTHNARQVETYSVQSAENWLEDYGTGVMERGVSVVKIDPAFAATISATPDYHVFITPNGDAEALYVINKTANGFEVRESKGGTSSLTFDYKIVARRSGHEAERLVDVTDQMKLEAASSHFKPLPDGPPVNPNHPGVHRASRKLPPQLALKSQP